MRVDFGMLGQGEGDCFDHDVVERDLVLIAHLGELRTRLGSSGGVELGSEEESRNWAIRLRKPARDGLSDLGEGDVLKVSFASESLGCSGSSGTAGRLRVLNIPFDDAPAWSSALDGAQLESSLARDPPSQRRRALPSARR
jgi:hypothetical protein